MKVTKGKEAAKTPAQQKHLDKANALEDRASQTIENTKSGRSGAAAKTILDANKERKKAGLIKGALKV
jgi:hypothetical protein